MVNPLVRAALACVFLAVSVFGSSEGALNLPWLPPAMDPLRPMYLADQTPTGQPPAAQQPGQPGAASPSQPTPEPYSKDEFPQWLQDLWRAEVIFVGSLPFTYFYTLEGYDFIRYAFNSFSPAYAPWPFQAAANIRYSSEENLGLVISTLTLSIAVSAADYIIRRFIEPNEKY
jgi:hypothetical protein